MEAAWPSGYGAGLLIWWSWVQGCFRLPTGNFLVISLDLLSTWLHSINSQLVCLLPVGNFNHFMFIYLIIVCIGPEKPHWGSGQLRLFPFLFYLFSLINYYTFEIILTGLPFSSLTSQCSTSGSKNPTVPRWRIEAMMENRASCSSEENSITDKAFFTCLKSETSFRVST